MARKTYLTEEEKLDIVAGFEGGMTIRDIAKAVDRAPSTVSSVLEEKGVRKIKSTGPKPRKQSDKSNVTCPNCRATGHYKGAKFCYRCGADIRTESDILRERLGKLVADMQFLPESVRDNAYTVIQDAIDYLRKV